MAFDWQILAAGACVTLAAIVIAIRAVKLLRGSGGGCATGSCQECPQTAPEQPHGLAQPLISLDETPRPHPSSDLKRIELVADDWAHGSRGTDLDAHACEPIIERGTLETRRSGSIVMSGSR